MDDTMGKIVWIGIVVAIAVGIYYLAKPQIDTYINGIFTQITKMTDKAFGQDKAPDTGK